MAAFDRVSLFEESKPFASSAVWACVVYSLVPFVGIVFVPFIFVFGVVAAWKGDPVDRRAFIVGVVVLIGQLVLWWLLYVVPNWSAVV